MTNISALLLILFSYVSYSAGAQDCTAEAAPGLASALSPLLSQNHDELNLQALKICEPLAQKDLYQKLADGRRWESSANEVLSLETYVDEQEEQTKKLYLKRLNEITKIPEITGRLQEAYELAVKSYGAFQRPKKNLEILRQMKSHNARGADAQRAALVAYTLSKVIEKKEAKLSVVVAPLGSDTYISHTWVQVAMGPNYSRKIDLDPTLSGVNFVPFLPRKSGLSAAIMEKLQAECSQLIFCLSKNSIGASK